MRSDLEKSAVARRWVTGKSCYPLSENRRYSFLLLLLAVLVVGTLGIELFTDAYAGFTLPVDAAERWQATLDRLVPCNASQGQ